MRFLIISISTIKGIRGIGVPSGTRWAKAFRVSLIQVYIIKESHRGTANLRVTAKCLVAVKI